MSRSKELASETMGSFSRGKQIIWSSRTLSTMACAMVITYVSYYGSNILEIPVGIVGTLILASKMFDAVTDLIAGYLIDRTKTKLGKARPYELSILGLWGGTVLMYACPNLGLTGKCIWLFIWYTLVNDVFFTLMNADEPVYMLRAIPNRHDMEKTASLNGIFTVIGSMSVSLIYPLLMVNMGSTKKGWTEMALIFAIPLTLIGLLRFIFIPEVNNVQQDKKEKVSFSDVKTALTSNRYIYFYFLLWIIVNMFSMFSGANTYYFTYVVKNQAMMSVVSIPGMISPFLLLFFPKLLKKHTVIKISVICGVIGIIGCGIKQFAGANIILLLVGTFVAGIGTLPLAAFMVILLTDIVDYNEWKTNKRIEGIYASIGSCGQKIGLGLSSALTGGLLQLGGFISSNDATQPDSAISMIRATYGIVPGLLLVVMVIILLLFDLEKKMPEVRSSLENMRKADKLSENN